MIRDWLLEAACRGFNDVMFDPGSLELALGLCEGCGVRSECSGSYRGDPPVAGVAFGFVWGGRRRVGPVGLVCGRCGVGWVGERGSVLCGSCLTRV